MNKRENLLSLLRRQGYCEVPFEFSLCKSLHNEYREKYGTKKPYADFFGFPWVPVGSLQLPEIDYKIFEKYFDPPLKPDASINCWGVGHEPSPTSMHMTYMRNPMRNMTTLEEIKSYPLPDYEHASAAHQKFAVESAKALGLASVGHMACTVWETSWYMRSMEEIMMDMMCEDEKATYIFEEVTKRAILNAQSFAKAGVDILYLGDDIGMQSTIMMSVEMYCKWLKPRLKRIIDSAKAIKPDIIVIYHSCGYVIPFIEHLIDAGIDVLNPIQSECMEFEEVHREYGERLSFHGTIGTQTVMPFGTPGEVRDAVWHNLDIAGKKGGLFPAPTHLLEPEVPWENILAYIEACKSYETGC